MLEILFHVIISSDKILWFFVEGLKYMNLKRGLKSYRHAWVLLYALIYMPWFRYLEQRSVHRYYLIHSPLDDCIPFVEYFIVPYLLWFIFVFAGVAYFFFTDKKGYYRLTAFLFSGMTIFLIICTLFPNGTHLRPETFAHDNLFTDLVRILYSIDTPTNVLPSIHVFNSLGICFAIGHSEALKQKKWIRYGTYAAAGLIILSTMFLKQHSVTDVFAATVMAGVIYPFVYLPAERKAPKFSHQPV